MKDVKFVKTVHTLTVKLVKMDITCMKTPVLHVPHVNYNQDGSVMPVLTNVYLVTTNVKNVHQLLIIVTLVSNQELPHHIVIAQPDNTMMV
jgi:hypothetical protein